MGEQDKAYSWAASKKQVDASWFRGKAVADRVVSHRRRRDRRELFIVVIEGVRFDAEQTRDRRSLARLRIQTFHHDPSLFLRRPILRRR